MKIGWLANAPFTSTGYGNQTRLFAPRINRFGFPVACFSNWGLEGGVLTWEGMPLYPKAWHPWGLDIVGAHLAHFQADVLISLVDAWVMEPRYLQGVRWAPWFPVDMEPLPKRVADAVRHAWQPIVYSKFGQRMCEDAGIEAAYVPHGVDTQTFCPGDQGEARDYLGLPRDTFIVGMVAANKDPGDRKAFRTQLEGFAQFHAKHPDSLLYLHTYKGENGPSGSWNLVELAEALGISDAVRFADQYGLVLGLPDTHMVQTYRAFDVLLSASMGEGFGIPILESQACGTPVIVGGWTSMGELCFSGVTIDKTAALKEWTPLAAWQWVPFPDEVAKALDNVYRIRMGSGARKGALAYDADTVFQDYWLPLLARMESRVEINKRLLAA